MKYTPKYGTIIRTPYKPNLANRLMLKYGKGKFSLLRKLITAWYEFMQFIFFVGPKSGVYCGAKKYLKTNKVDAIIATGEPFILFKYASSLSKKYGVPWLADYRDPWSQNKNRSKFSGRWNKYFEKKFTANTECVVTVSDFCKIQIETNVHKSFHIISNGYNPDAINAVSDIKQGGDCLRFAFVGTIYSWHPYKSVILTFVEFIQKSNLDIKIELNFFGINRHEKIRQIARENNIEEYIHVYPRMDNACLLENLCKQNVMLLFNDYSIMGTKIYDYLGLKRNILLCYSDDEDAKLLKEKFYPIKEVEGLSTHLQEDLINQTHSGIVAKDKTHLEQILVDLYAEFVRMGSIECCSVDVDRFSRREGVRSLAEIIKNITLLK